MKVVVTGGAGFIGSHVADAFLERGDEVLIVDDLSSGKREHLHRDAAFAEVDIADAESLHETLKEFAPEVVCHLAAQSSITVSVADPNRDFASNVRGTFNVGLSANQLEARVLFASTGGGIYGNGAPMPTPESHVPQPLAPYGASKLAGEAYISTWSRFYGRAHVSLRLANVYGPRQNPHGEAGVVAIFSDRLIRNEPPVVYGHGKPTRDYVHVADIARAFTLLADTDIAGTYNIGRGQEISVLELLESLQRAAGTDVKPRLEPLRPGELERSAIDSRAAAEAFGWHPEIEFDHGIAETFRWYASAVAR